ncbi:MAG: extracellular solute-binding protein, partial [Bacillota bacterium]|nr:extracellular solute-binding protein [Bacillota bacterium]
LVKENEALKKWLEGPFRRRLKDEYGVRLVVKETTMEKITKQLTDEKLLQDRNLGVPGSYDIIIFDGEGFGTFKKLGLIYSAFVDKLPGARLIDRDALSFQYRDTFKNEGSFVPIGRDMLTFLYSTDIFYDSPETYHEVFDTISKLKGYATYPDPRYTKEGEAFLLGLVAEKVNMEPYVKPGRNLEEFEREVREALQPLVNIRANIMDAGLTYPTNIEQLFTDKKTYFSMSMDYMRVGEKVKEYEYPDSTNCFVLRPVGTYTTVGVIPFNSENKAGAMVTLSELLSPSSQAGLVTTGLMTVYYENTPVDKVEPLKTLKLHRTIPKFSSYIDATTPEFDRELIDIVLYVWEDLVVE